MDTHYSEDDLTLYYYGEARQPASVEAHLARCGECAALYRDVADTLAMIPVEEPPERSEQYGLEVWQRIRRRLPGQERRSWRAPFAWLRMDRLAVAAGAALVMIAAFTAGRFFPGSRGSAPSPASRTDARPAADAGRRILLASVADHLDRSERVLTDLMNTADPADLSSERAWAEDLLTASRLYRQDAVDAGEQSVAAVLDELERNLLEVVHSPDKMSSADLDQIRRRIDAAALLFKVRVMSDEIRQREQAPDDRSAPRTSTRKIS